VSEATVAMTEAALALFVAFAGRLERAREIFEDVYARFRAADDAPGFGGVLMNRGVAEERAGNRELAADLFEQSAEIWERHVFGHLPGQTWLAAADMRARLGDADRARAAAARAERLLTAAGDHRGAGLARSYVSAAPSLSPP
jgi:tetratricopeptide (TPR) repeat protein